jgi:hypothetical protein
MTSLVDSLSETRPSPLQADLIEMLKSARAAERDLFGMLTSEQRDEPNTVGNWSAKDVLAHLAAWRAIEARRLEATIRGETDEAPGDPARDEPIDESNAKLREQHAPWTWDEVDRKADASVEALIAAISRSSTTALCECDGTVAGIGANGANHAMAHLIDVAHLAGAQDRFDTLAQAFEEILSRGHLLPRDSGVILYNIACYQALAGDTDDARRVLRAAFRHRHELLETAKEDPDLAALSDELEMLAAPA